MKESFFPFIVVGWQLVVTKYDFFPLSLSLSLALSLRFFWSHSFISFYYWAVVHFISFRFFFFFLRLHILPLLVFGGLSVNPDWIRQCRKSPNTCPRVVMMVVVEWLTPELPVVSLSLSLSLSHTHKLPFPNVGWFCPQISHSLFCLLHSLCKQTTTILLMIASASLPFSLLVSIWHLNMRAKTTLTWVREGERERRISLVSTLIAISRKSSP